ncbi:hypothetical protein EMIHUDRAFT_460382 [Emiliania huxleyi CCMP1516]|uniref:NAD(P)-binding domain-containing protein n=2 Tax=Emiliania huxleyi TaxID=2903 RepID=A0A0D3IT30_EMIH1|nr:hypothetical protein EMIHUDRAFT_451816 [Emiliania huxleyi CCMP1516]XP_005792479.1 hypothetical protein EMIHUDRAFT_460382 [Emiliania huxleyi CCMP1516]EOD14415.1 hypothetical protein EMIHUDRAFT_451816 [Emiliania huxleyi CCMP1516]EOD40050.1 hypothetical protein EMIHUDRAFT_460382 [Emiliania huxleyi CCMP1516]|eukprot:XP_005766844.1 hypothetical protein EMIHUDRAFT_451816 [Emiliania huxleyi CCMP1516]
MASSSSPPPIPLFKVFVAPPEELDDELLRVVHSGYVTQGPKVEAFEEALRAFLQSPRVVTVNSGTSALHLALHLLKRAEGGWPGLQESVDEVLTCPLTCTATNWPILANGLRIKWVDADPATANVCLDDLEAKLSPTTKVIMVVHWGGSPVDLGRLAAIQERCFSRFGFRPAVIEDCAHAFGAEWGGRKLGSHGNFCCFSLQAIKHVTAVDGGVLIAPTQRLFERARLVRWFGIDRERRSGGGDFRMEPPVEEFGFKFHMNDVNATVGEANLRHAPRLLAACRANAEFYQRSLAGLPHVTLLRDLPVGAVSAYWLFTLRAGIASSAVHQRNDLHPCVASVATRLPQLNSLAEEILCLPVGWWVGPAERERVVCAVRSWAEAPPQRALAAVPGARAGLGARKRERGECGRHHTVEHFVRNTDFEVVVLDKLSYASKGYDRLRDSGVFHLIQTYCVDLASALPPGLVLVYELEPDRVAVILHIAAETHVDNSIDSPVPFVENNIKSTLTMLEFARTLPQLTHFVYFSTDEEGDAHKPSNPYSASKSAAEMICQSYFNTYRVPLVTMNKLTIHAYDGSLRAGSRFYIHARNIAAAVLFVLHKAELGEKYNVKGEAELDNLEVARFIAAELGRELVYEMHDRPDTRPGHDLRYSLDGTKLEELGWKLPFTFEESLRKTIRWTIENPRWLDGDGLFAAPSSKL